MSVKADSSDLTPISITGIEPGPATATDESGQVVTLSVTSISPSGIIDPAIIGVISGAGDTRILSYTLDPSAKIGDIATITVLATDDVTPAARTTSREFTITVVPATLVITTSTLPDGTVGDNSYSEALQASGGTGSFTWALTNATSLPDGLSLDAGVISGEPTTIDVQNFTVEVTDAAGATATKDLTITVVPATLVITTSTLPDGTVGDNSYSEALQASGGTGSFTWALTNATSLPDGLSLDAGVISGEPTTIDVQNFTVEVTDAAGATATKGLTITVVPA